MARALADIQRDGVDAAVQIAQRLMHSPMTRHARHRPEGRRTDQDAEMAFPRPVVARMAAVPAAVIGDDEPRRRKALGEAGGDFGKEYCLMQKQVATTKKAKKKPISSKVIII